jgi:hypothetical protein
VLLSSPVVADKVRGDAEKPWTKGTPPRVVVVAASVRGGEGLRREVVGKGGADTTGEVAVDRWEQLFEAALEGPAVGEAGPCLPFALRPPALQTFSLSRASETLQRAAGAGGLGSKHHPAIRQ